MERPRSEFLEQSERLMSNIACSIAQKPGFRAVKRLVEPLAVKRLQQVIKRINFKGPQRILIECRDKDDKRHRFGAGCFKDGEAVQLGHLYIEEDQLRFEFANEGDGFAAVRALSRDLDLRVAGQHASDPAASERLVVDDQHADPSRFSHRARPPPNPNAMPKRETEDRPSPASRLRAHPPCRTDDRSRKVARAARACCQAQALPATGLPSLQA